MPKQFDTNRTINQQGKVSNQFRKYQLELKYKLKQPSYHHHPVVGIEELEGGSSGVAGLKSPGDEEQNVTVLRM